MHSTGFTLILETPLAKTDEFNRQQTIRIQHYPTREAVLRRMSSQRFINAARACGFTQWELRGV